MPIDAGKCDDGGDMQHDSYQTLIDVAALARLQARNETKLCLLDCRFDLMQPAWGQEAYRQGHISGALYAHLDRDLSGPVVPGVTGRHPLPHIDAIVDTLSAWGVDRDTQVVAYDDKGGMFAARLWWMLRWLGHDKVALLDGGLAAWQAAGLPCDDVLVEPSRASFKANVQMQMLVSAEDVLAAIADDDINILDARGADRYRGENETIDPVAGHIPGAKSAPFMNNLQDGFFKSKAQLHADYQTLRGKEATIVYCGSGVTAAHDVLAMTHAGFNAVQLYAGSWSHWITDPTRPIAIGNE